VAALSILSLLAAALAALDLGPRFAVVVVAQVVF
jgi:hypothetical protein